MRRALEELHDPSSDAQTIDQAARLRLHIVAGWLVIREGYDALVHGPEHAWLRHWSGVRGHSHVYVGTHAAHDLLAFPLLQLNHTT